MQDITQNNAKNKSFILNKNQIIQSVVIVQVIQTTNKISKF